MVDRFALQNDGPDWRMGTCCTIKSLFLIQNVDAMKLSVYITMQKQLVTCSKSYFGFVKYFC